jgi:hypothetical protein
LAKGLALLLAGAFGFVATVFDGFDFCFWGIGFAEELPLFEVNTALEPLLND